MGQVAPNLAMLIGEQVRMVKEGTRDRRELFYLMCELLK
jgi:hypothetical protein